MNKLIISIMAVLLSACIAKSGDATDAASNQTPGTSVGLSQDSGSNCADGQELALNSGAESTAEGQSGGSAARSNYPLGVQALMDAYPKFIKGYDGQNIIFADGTKMLYDDGKQKSFAVMLDNSDIEDMFYTPYVLPKNGNVPEYQADAGRSRNDALFKKMYGSSAAAVQRNLVSVNWNGQKVMFTNVNGAADSLRKVAAELNRHPELKKYLKSSGTFYWRPVRGAKRMSAHSYGIAFDIAVDYSDYWLWKNGNRADENARVKYANRIPVQIAEIFQKYGFIWGGAWYHFDTMHFEFRPEILRYAKLKGKN